MFHTRVQRLSVETGFTCPNRDGSKGWGGCIYCNNDSFMPPYAVTGDLNEQIRQGKQYLKERFHADKFIAYFQSYTNTYGPVSVLKEKIRQVLDDKDVVGISVSTRPDCLEREVLDFLKDISRYTYVNLEIGVESIYDKTLFWMNRCHTMKDTLQAFAILEEYSFDVTAHVILGSPTETREEMLAMTREINQWKIRFLKLHHLQVIRGARLEKEYLDNPFHLFEYKEYLDLVTDFISRIKPEIIFQRLFAESPGSYLVAPVWKKRTTEIIMDIQKTMHDKGLWQAGQL
ncbi:MAG: TIGR01212 family radical SAM protein [Candidatus Marinimicrobia bacterium]|nr:TIGR01212 family radical SAM protein [Candidatus Neomarinimicrobiota bacterium]